MGTDTSHGQIAGVVPFRPTPIQALTVSFRAADGTLCAAVIRRWTAVAAARCRLCRSCTAKVGADRQAVCVVPVQGDPPRGPDALYYSPDGPD